MEEAKKAELTSAAAFVEGGVQEACEDACSICLEGFSDSDPSTVTSCKHDFHLQCVLEWCQRSSNCPMCWETLKLKDPASQELLDAVERERIIRSTPPRNTRIFHHPTLGDFELRHLPVGVNDTELEEQIMRHLAAATAMGESGTHRMSRSRPDQVVVHPPHPNTGGERTPEMGSFTFIQSNRVLGSSSGDNRNRGNWPSSPNRDGAGPSEFHSFSNTWKSRFSSMSSKYKESISRNTKELKEKLFSRSPSMANIGSEVRREVSATVSRVMERFEARDTIGTHTARTNSPESTSVDDVAQSGLPTNSVSS